MAPQGDGARSADWSCLRDTTAMAHEVGRFPGRGGLVRSDFSRPQVCFLRNVVIVVHIVGFAFWVKYNVQTTVCRRG